MVSGLKPKSCTLMGRTEAPKRVRYIAPELPDDLLHYIFLKLDFKSKVNAGQVCKKWDELLKASSAVAKHWGVVCYKVKPGVKSQASTQGNMLPLSQQFETGMGRWISKRAGAIESVKVSATLSSDQRGVASMKVLETSLPLLAGCLSSHDIKMDLSFEDGSPFTSPLLSSPDSLTLLSPMVTSLHMCNVKVYISESHFASICELSMLKSLQISRAHEDSDEDEDETEWGLEQLTSQISKLVNLTSLDLDDNHLAYYIPESISCLQKLTRISISGSSIMEVPSGLSKLANLVTLSIEEGCMDILGFPSCCLQGLNKLTSVSFIHCRLALIPEALCGIPCLLSMNLCGNWFGSRDGWPWWPTDLSRLTRLQRLDLRGCGIRSLPPHISGLRGLQELHIPHNNLSTLPDGLSCLRGLQNFQADGNCFATVPVSVLSKLTSMSFMNFSHQRNRSGPPFQVPASLLPILHPGLVKLDLRHDNYQRDAVSRRLLRQNHQWDALSLCHLESAMAEVANRTPPVEVLWGITR